MLKTRVKQVYRFNHRTPAFHEDFGPLLQEVFQKLVILHGEAPHYSRVNGCNLTCDLLNLLNSRCSHLKVNVSNN